MTPWVTLEHVEFLYSKYAQQLGHNTEIDWACLSNVQRERFSEDFMNSDLDWIITQDWLNGDHRAFFWIKDASVAIEFKLLFG